MKTENLNLAVLTSDELHSINGGSLIGDIAYLAGYTLHAIVEIGRAAGEFQQSLPSGLKK